MNASVQTLPANPGNTKPLWAAVGVLGIAVLALGASLVHVQNRPVDGQAALAALAPAAQPEAAPAPVAKVLAPEPGNRQDDLVAPPKAPVVLAKPIPAKVVKPIPTVAPAAAVTVATAPVPVAVVTPTPMPTQMPMPVAIGAGSTASAAGNATGAPSVVTNTGLIVSQSAVPVAKPVCANCGTIETVTVIQRHASTAGVGTVAGGVVGAVVGNQVGKGSGRALATILGAVGGGLAGNAIEKNVRKETVYQVRVRMEDGSARTIEQASLPAVGTKVTVEGGVLHAADGSWSAPAVTKPLPQAQSPQIYNRT